MNPEQRKAEMEEKIGELTKDLATLRHKAQDNEARWQAVCADLEAKLKVAATALQVYAMTNEIFPEYGDVARETLAKIKELVE